MKLPRMTELENSSSMPSPEAAITLLVIAGDAETTEIPSKLPSGCVPVTSVPMRLPVMAPELSAFVTMTAVPGTPEMTLRSAGSAPPIAADAATSSRSPFPNTVVVAAASPEALVPMRLPRTDRNAPTSVTTPASVCPEMRLRSNADVPPIATCSAFTTRTPKPWGPGTEAPDGSVPR